MIDFVKIVIYDTELIASVWNNNTLNYHSDSRRVNKSTGELISKELKQLNNLLITRYSNSLTITGSLHYFHNNGIHNANDFHADEAIKVINKLKQIFDLDLSKCFVKNLEFGVNIVLPFDAKRFINGLVYSGKNKFVNDTELPFSFKAGNADSNGRFIHYKTLKAYIKSLQFPNNCQPHTFRLEIKSKQNKFINKLGVKTLEDLLSPKIYNTFGKILLKEWQNILLIDQFIDSDSLPKKYLKYLNPLYWQQTIMDGGYRNKFSYDKKRYKEHLKFNYPNNAYHTFEKVLKEKISAVSTKLKNSAISTTSEISAISTRIENSADSSSYINGNCTTEPKLCLETGLDISMQKKNSFLLSHTGLWFYYENDIAAFNRIKRLYLSKIHSEKDIRIQIKEIGHNIRNLWNNKRNRLKKYNSEHESQYWLFAS